MLLVMALAADVVVDDAAAVREVLKDSAEICAPLILAGGDAAALLKSHGYEVPGEGHDFVAAEKTFSSIQFRKSTDVVKLKLMISSEGVHECLVSSRAISDEILAQIPAYLKTAKLQLELVPGLKRLWRAGDLSLSISPGANIVLKREIKWN